MSTLLRVRELVSLIRFLPEKCNNKACTANTAWWRQITKRATTVNLRGSTFCFPHCFERELRRLIEQMSITSSPANSRPRRLPLGLLLLSRGLITAQQLRQALEAQSQAGCCRIGEWLQRMSFATDVDVATALAQQWSCPVLRRLPRQLADCGLPIHLLRTFRMLPIYFSNGRFSNDCGVLHFAFARDIEHQALFTVEQMLACKTEVCLTTEKELDAGLEGLEKRRSEEKLFEHCAGPEELVRIVSSYAGRLSSTEVQIARCGNLFWARLLGQNRADLLFSGKDLDTMPGTLGAMTRNC